MVKKPIAQDSDFEEGENDPDIYDEEGKEKLVDEDEITDAEEGFMEGYEHGEHEAKCAKCKKVLTDFDESEIIEEEINEKHYLFCSKECADAFETGRKRKRGR